MLCKKNYTTCVKFYTSCEIFLTQQLVGSYVSQCCVIFKQWSNSVQNRFSTRNRFPFQILRFCTVKSRIALLLDRYLKKIASKERAKNPSPVLFAKP